MNFSEYSNEIDKFENLDFDGIRKRLDSIEGVIPSVLEAFNYSSSHFEWEEYIDEELFEIVNTIKSFLFYGKKIKYEFLFLYLKRIGLSTSDNYKIDIKTDQELRFLHGVLGMITEVYEYRSATDDTNKLEELGDILWFLSRACDSIGVNYQDAEVKESFNWVIYQNKKMKLSVLTLVRCILFKGYVSRREILCSMRDSFSSVEYLAGEHGFTIKDVMEANIRKLTKRYGEKFDENKAKNRDIDGEYDALRS